jgi:signal transduction histidine kinase
MAQGIYASRNGLLDSAFYFLELAKKHAQDGHDHRGLVRALAALGHTHISSGNPKEGLENFFEGLRVLNTHPDIEMEMKFRTNVAWAYLELKQYRDCIRFGLQNLRRMEGTSYEWIALYTYNNVAISYGALGKLDSASYYIQKGIHAAERAQDLQSLANGYFILGNIYADAGKHDLAIQQYIKARPYREKVGNPLFIVSDLYAMADLYYLTGDYKNGVRVGEEALKLAEQYNLLSKFEGAYQSLAKNYEGLGDFRNASNYYRLSASAKDSVYTRANASAMAEMQTRFETEKKEQQLALQRAQLAGQRAELELTYVIIAGLLLILLFIVIIYLLVRGRARRERELFIREAQIHATIQSQETERRRFARDLHDGMGQLISALRLAIHSIHSETPLEERVTVVTKAEKLLNDMHQEIRSIAFNLMPQTLVQNGLIPALKEMGNRMNETGRIVIRVNSFDVPERMTELHEISLYRIIQEWVNNVIKYADASTIDVQIVGYEEEISVIVEDNGKGFDTSVLERSVGNGWKNIRSRVNLIKGSVEIDSRPERRGTTLMIKVPVRKEADVPVASNTQ